MRTSVGFGPTVNGQENLTATGTDQATAFQITAQESVFTTVASGTGCRLPWASGATVSVYNLDVNALLVYPGSGDQIGSGSVNASVSVASGDSATFTSLAAPTSAIPRRWYQQSSGGGGIAGLDISNSGTALGTFTAIDALSGATFSDEGGGVAGLTVPLAVSVVTDGTTTVDPAITLTFDSAAFAVTDGGSGNAQVASGGGGAVYPRVISDTTGTLTVADNGLGVQCTNDSDVALTVPSGLGVFSCYVIQAGAGQVTPTASGTTINNRSSFTKTAGQYAVISLISTAADVFVMGGDGA